MTTEQRNLSVHAVSSQEQGQGTSRRAFLHRAAIAGALGAGSLLPLALPGAAAANLHQGEHDEDDDDDLKKRDQNILIAAEIAEALAVTTYTNIIDSAPFFTRLPSDVVCAS
jgi:hypothetical protein